MSARFIVIALLIVAAIGSGWLMNRSQQDDAADMDGSSLEPDYYMEDFTVLTMGSDGLPSSKLYAIYMEHNPIDDTSELYEPELEIYRTNKEPLFITADKGWIADDNEVVLLRGKVKLWEKSPVGEIILHVDTTEVKVLLEEEYAETDQYAVIVTNQTTVTGRGVRAHFDEDRLEILSHEKTTIEQSDTD